MRPDVVVVGAGMSGLAAAVRLAEGGAGVLVLAKGVGSLQLAPATIDLLGYLDDRVEDPLEAIGSLARRDPGHPYARLGGTAVREATRWLTALVEDGGGGYRYLGSADRNLLLPTAVGVPRPSALVPETMARGDVHTAGSLVVVGFRGMKDFHPALIADNLTRATGGALAARGVHVDPPGGVIGEPGPLGVARALDRPGAADELATRLSAAVRGDETLALPAVLSVRDAHGVWEILERRLGRPVYEIPTLPPSVPGLRLSEILRRRLQRAGGRLVTGAEVVGARASDDHVQGVRVRVSGGERTYPTRWIVLASGGVAAGGLELDADWHMRETVLGLDVAGVPSPGQARFTPRYLDEHPLGRAGIVTDGELRPIDADGARRFENALVVGALLAGAQPWREKSGEGIALTSGHRAAELILECERGARGTAAVSEAMA